MALLIIIELPVNFCFMSKRCFERENDNGKWGSYVLIWSSIQWLEKKPYQGVPCVYYDTPVLLSCYHNITTESLHSPPESLSSRLSLAGARCCIRRSASLRPFISCVGRDHPPSPRTWDGGRWPHGRRSPQKLQQRAEVHFQLLFIKMDTWEEKHNRVSHLPIILNAAVTSFK